MQKRKNLLWEEYIDFLGLHIENVANICAKGDCRKCKLNPNDLVLFISSFAV